MPLQSFKAVIHDDGLYPDIIFKHIVNKETVFSCCPYSGDLYTVHREPATFQDIANVIRTIDPDPRNMKIYLWRTCGASYRIETSGDKLCFKVVPGNHENQNQGFSITHRIVPRTLCVEAFEHAHKFFMNTCKKNNPSLQGSFRSIS